MHKVNSILPQFLPSFWRKDYGVFGLDFAEGVAVGFIERVDTGYSFLSVDEIAALGVEIDVLLEQVMSNLAHCAGATLKVAHPANSHVAWIEAEDNFSAIRMLLPDIQQQLFQQLGKPFHFTIPSRDLCLFWSKDAPSWLHEKHAAEAAEDFEQETHNLSSRVFVFDGQWPCQPYSPSI